jgi:hypothetical protein
MSVATIPSHNPILVPPHIGPARHPLRAAWTTIGVAAIVAVMAVSFVYWRGHNAVAAERLTRFQALYAERCDTSAFTPPAAALAQKLYLGSSTLQRAVDRQVAALEAGAACDEIFRALRAVDFPLPSSVPPPARSATIAIPEAR